MQKQIKTEAIIDYKQVQTEAPWVKMRMIFKIIMHIKGISVIASECKVMNGVNTLLLYIWLYSMKCYMRHIRFAILLRQTLNNVSNTDQKAELQITQEIYNQIICHLKRNMMQGVLCEEYQSIF